MNPMRGNKEADNLTTERQGYTYEYDYENRIVKITEGETDITEYSYDALGRRVEKKDCITSTNTGRYYYDKDWRILNDYDTSATPVMKRRYLYGNYIDEVLVSMASPSTSYVYVHDHLYNTVALCLRTTAAIVERYEYDAYGRPTIYTGIGNGTWWDGDETTSSASAKDNTYMFTGRQVDILDGGALKIQYNRNRYYDYYTGRWTTQDPAGMGHSPSQIVDLYY